MAFKRIIGYLALTASLLAIPSVGTAQEPCEILTDFENPAQNRYWRTINDGVMGGKSFGRPTFDNGLLQFSGVLNTDGGGFSSLRARLSDGRLDGVSHVIIRAKTEGRTFNFTAEDNQWLRRMAIAHRAEMKTDVNWQNIKIDLGALTPTYFGRKIDADPFTPKDARSIGFIISDGTDGPFALTVDWIKICR